MTTLLQGLRETQQIRTQNQKIRLWLYQLESRLVQVKRWKQILLLRNLVYQQFPMQHHGVLVFPLDWTALKAARAGKSPLQSRELALIYIRLLSAFEISSRLVALASTNALSAKTFRQNPDTHFVVEVLHKGRWTLQDPTYNLQWNWKKRSLGISQLRTLLLSGKKPVSTSTPFSQSGRRLKHPFRNMHALVQNVEIRYVQTAGKQAGKERLVSSYPKGLGWSVRQKLTPLLTGFSRGFSLRSWNWKARPASGWQLVTMNPQQHPHLRPRIRKFPKTRKKTKVFLWKGATGSAWVSGPWELGPGNYVFRIKGHLKRGMLKLGLWKNGQWWGAHSLFHASQWSTSKGDMVLRWKLKQHQSLRLVVESFRPRFQQDSYHLAQWQAMELLSVRDAPTSRPTSRPVFRPQDVLVHRLDFNLHLKGEGWKRNLGTQQPMRLAYLSMLQRNLRFHQLVFRNGLIQQGYWFSRDRSSLSFRARADRKEQTLGFWLWKQNSFVTTSVVAGLSDRGKLHWQVQLLPTGQICFASPGQKRYCSTQKLPSQRWFSLSLRWKGLPSGRGELLLGQQVLVRFPLGTLGRTRQLRWGAAAGIPSFRGGLDEVFLFRKHLQRRQLRELFYLHSSLMNLKVPTRLFAGTGRAARKMTPEERQVQQSEVLHLRFDGELSLDPRFHTPNQAHKTGLDIGVHKGAVWLNGRDSYVRVVQQSSFPQQTLEFWMSPQRHAGGVVASQTRKLGGNWRWKIFFDAQGQFCLQWFDSRTHLLCTPKPPALDKWVHVAVTWDTKNQKIAFWLAGKKEAESTLQSNIPNGDLWLGVARDAGFFKGALDEVVLYNRVLTPSQLKRHATLDSPAFLQPPAAAVQSSRDDRSLLFAMSCNQPPRTLQAKLPRLKFQNVRYTFGMKGGGYYFNGKNSLVRLNETFSFPKQTMMLWVKPFYQSGPGGLLASQAAPPSKQWRWQLFLHDRHFVCFHIYDSGLYKVCSKRILNDGAWNHIAVTLDETSKQMKLYVNGELDGTATMKGNPPYGQLLVGTSSNGGRFRGSMDSIAIYRNVMTADQIKAYALRKRRFRDPMKRVRKGELQAPPHTLRMHLTFNLPARVHPTFRGRLKAVGTVQDFGVQGQSYYFHGKKEQLVLARARAGKTQTYSLWFRPSKTKSQGLLALQDMNGKSRNWSWQLLLNGKGKVCFLFFDEKQFTLCSKKPVPRSLWTHVAITWDVRSKKRVRLFINGRKEQEVKANNLNMTGSLVVGKSRYASFFQGAVDELMVYDKALPPKEIKALSNPDNVHYRQLYPAYLKDE